MLESLVSHHVDTSIVGVSLQIFRDVLSQQVIFYLRSIYPPTLNCRSPNVIGKEAIYYSFIFWSFYSSSDSPVHVTCSQRSQSLPILKNPSPGMFPKCFSDNVPINSKKHIPQDYYSTLLQTGRFIKFI